METKTYITSLIGAATLMAANQILAQEHVVKIGLTSPLTGAQAAVGEDHINGVKMAIAEVNNSNLLIGGKKVKFEILPEDDQADPKTGVNVAQKFADMKVAAVLGPYNSGVAIPASKVYNNAGIPMLAVASNPKITKQGFSNVFRIGASDSQLGGTIGTFAGKELKLKKVAVIDDRTAYGQGVAEEFIKTAKENGIEIVAREYTTDKSVDFATILSSLKAKKVEGIFYGGYFPQGAPMRRQMKQLGLGDLYFLGGDAICASEMGKLGGDAVDDRVYCTQGGAVLETQDGGNRFVAKYQSLYNKKPLIYAVSFYDGVFVLAKAMKKADSVDPVKFMPVLQNIAYRGTAGTYAFDNNHDLKSAPITVYRFKNGDPVAFKSYE
jgi:ABC-type branched-subunit amino acid transport system substrate-binding protein